MVIFLACVAAAAVIYQRLWIFAPLHHWRESHSEHGEASWQLIVIAVALIGAITVLLLHGDQVPDVLTQGLSGVLIGIGTSEATLRKHEQAAGKAVHPKRHTTKTPHPSKEP